MDTVLYHQHGQAPKPFKVIRKHKDDGTIDIGLEDGTVKVERCQVTKDPRPGAATVPTVSESPETMVRALRAKAVKLATAAEKAATAAAAKPDDQALAKAAADAKAAAEQADAEATAAEQALKDF